MLKNYLLIALRNIAANRLFSALNILGLAFGLAVCILIVLYVRYESSYDQHWQNSEQIYRVSRDFGNEFSHLASIAPPFSPLLKARFPEIDDIVRIGMGSTMPLSWQDKQFNVENFLWADKNIFEFFQLEFIAGDKNTALERHSTLVMTETQAKRFFGNEDPIGKTLLMMGQFPVEVTGVIKDLPPNTHLQFPMLGSLSSVQRAYPQAMENWSNNSTYTFIKVADKNVAKRLEQKFPALLQEQFPDMDENHALYLQPIADIHLHSRLMFELGEPGSYVMVLSFSAIAFVILLIACINFMNLSTARATLRAKEVGLRKVAGASRAQLIIQFLSEAVVLTTIAMLIACSLVELILPWFTAFVELPLTSLSLYTAKNLGFLLLLVAVVGCIAGSYPAFYLSGFKPAQVLKGDLAQAGGSSHLRKGLVVLQFSISIVLLICTAVVVLQTQYARTLDPGYNKAQNLILDTPYAAGLQDMNAVYRAMREKLSAHPGVLSVTRSNQAPANTLFNSSVYYAEGVPRNEDNMVALDILNVGYNFIEHYEIPLLAGRSFSEKRNDPFRVFPDAEQPVTKTVAVISRSAAKQLGYQANEAIGKVLSAPTGTQNGNDFFMQLEVIGVVEDVHFGSLLEEQNPMIYHLVEESSQNISVKIDTDYTDELIPFIHASWQELMPNRAVNLSFLDENFEAMYNSQDKQATMFIAFSSLAIAVACLGLFGLASFTTARRTKEIGVRKVMGASVPSIVVLLTKEFAVLVLIANVIAWPIAALAMRAWLKNFSQNIGLPFSVFIFAAVLALLIAWLTVASHATRAAMRKPVHALRYE
ncbi:ABC transporter permease [Agaribacterium haliotis]|uniref:ABC transporter permease n=1 Tax=Agaribacterium haliotis TaxID=2013869 RepID=UPI0013044D71|nr:ABC transporter permease [Agaribacterium haliotis]